MVEGYGYYFGFFAANLSKTELLLAADFAASDLLLELLRFLRDLLLMSLLLSIMFLLLTFCSFGAIPGIEPSVMARGLSPSAFLFSFCLALAR